MRLELNGNAVETSATTLDLLLRDFGFEVASVATAVNEAFVPRGLRVATLLKDGDRIEVLSPMQGG